MTRALCLFVALFLSACEDCVLRYSQEYQIQCLYVSPSFQSSVTSTMMSSGSMVCYRLTDKINVNSCTTLTVIQ